MNHNLFIEHQVSLFDSICQNEIKQLLEPTGIDYNSEEGALVKNEWINIHKLLLKHKQSHYDGQVTLVKAMVPEAIHDDMSPERKRILNKLQNNLQNGFDRVIPKLKVIPVQARHFSLFNEYYLTEIAKIIQKMEDYVV